MANPYGAITDVSGIEVGHAQRIGDGWLTGVTAVLPPAGTIGAVDVRGGGPGTRETDALASDTLVEAVHAVALCGGSAYGLAAASGVQRWCEEHERGFAVQPGVLVPIVPAAVVFDLGRGGDPRKRPDDQMGYDAATAAAGGEVVTGTVGAGTGTTLGLAGLKGGLGTASVRLGGGIVVGAVAAVNAYGTPCVPDSGELLATPLVPDPALRPVPPRADDTPAPPAGVVTPGGNTTLAVVATNARIPHPQLKRTAMSGHDGLARALRPVHTLVDGDTVFALSTGELDPEPAAIGDWGDARTVGGLAAVQAAAADAVTLAILDGVLSATGVATPAIELPSYLERHPSARPSGW